MFHLHTALRRIPIVLVFAILALAAPVGAVDWQLEAGSVALPATDVASVFVPVAFQQTFAVSPVVVVLASSVDEEPVAVRVRGVTATGFELVQVEPAGEDGPHGPVEVHYLAVEPGKHLLADGTWIEAGLVSTAAVQHGTDVTGARSWDDIIFAADFASPPVLLANLQTAVNEAAAIPGAPSAPWLVVALRSVTVSGADVALERSESAPGEVTQPETIGWVAIETGVVTTLRADDGSTVGLEALLTEDTIAGWDNGCRRVEFAGTYTEAPLVVGHQETRDGGDGGWLRRCAVDAAGVELAVDEDRFRDSERSHTTEVAGLVILERAFHAMIQSPPVVRLGAASVRVIEGGGSVTVGVVLDHTATDAVEIDYATADGTATAGADYTGVADTLTIPAGQAGGTITVPIFDDGLIEGAETFSLTLTGVTNGFLGQPVDAEVLIADDDTSAEPGWRFEVDSIDLPATDASSTFVPVSFRQTYAEPPVVVVLSSSADGDPVAVRVRGVTTTGFELLQVEPGGEDGPHGSVEVHYLAVEAGEHILEDGTRIAAGLVSTAAVQHGSGVTGTLSWDDITFAAAFASPPVLLADLQTTVNESAAIPGAPSEPWLVVALRSVTASGAEVALERSESAPGEVTQPETIGWVAVEAGVVTTLQSNDGSTIGLEALLTEDVIAGWGNGCRRVDFAETYAQAPLVVGHQDRRDGGDGGWLRRCAVDAAGVELAVDEDRFRDTERSHTTEAAGLVVVGKAFDAVIQSPPVVRLAVDSVRVTEGGGDVTVGVILDHPVTDAVEVDYATADGTASTGVDYTGVADTLTIAAGQVSGTITVPILDDGLIEGAETFSLTLTGIRNGFLDQPVAVNVLIADDDTSVEPGWRFEVDSIDLPATDASSTFVPVWFRQAYAEPPVVVVLSSSADGDPVAVRVRGVTATGFELVQVEPGGEDGPHGSVEVHYLAAEPGDHILSDGTRIEAGLVSTAAVQHGTDVVGARSWDDITFAGSFASPPVLLADLQTTVNEAAAIPGAPSEPWLVVALRSITASGAEVALERSESAPGEVTQPEMIGWVAVEAGVVMTLQANGGSAVGLETLLTEDAIAGWSNGCRRVDFTGTYAQAPLVVGHQNRRDGGDGGWLRRCAVDAGGVELAVDEDRFRDTERSHTTEAAGLVVVGKAFDAMIAGSVPVVPEVYFAEASANVGESDGSVVLTVNLSGASAVDVSVDYETTDGAADGADYTSVGDTVVIPAGQTNAEITIQITDDSVVEGDEAFSVSLSNPNGATLGLPSTVPVIIVDDDFPLPSVQLASSEVTVGEAEAGVNLDVVLSVATTTDVTVDYATTDGTATEGADYTATSGNLNIPAGQLSGTITVPILADDVVEGDEDFTLTLSNAQGATIGTPATSTVTITDDDVEISSFLSLETAAASVSEEEGSVELTVRLEPAADSEVSVRLALAGGAAVPGVDYTPVDQVLVFPAGETSRQVTVDINDDTTFESLEFLKLALAAPTAPAGLGDQATAAVEITANDTPPSVFLGVGLEGDARYASSETLGEVVVPVRLSEPSGVAAKVHFETVDDQAIAGVDYGAVSTTLVFGPGQVEKLVTIPIYADGIPEVEEDFDVELSDPVGCTFAGHRDGRVVIFDNRELAFTVDSVSVPENAGSVELTVALSEPSDWRIEFDWRTSAGTATADVDYQEIADSPNIEAGESEATISIPLIEDDFAEADETFTVSLFFSGEGAIAAPHEVTVTILDNDDQAILFDGSSFEAGEGDGAATLTVVLNEVQGHDVSVDWAVSGGTARFEDDYENAAGTVTVPAGETSADFQVDLIDDDYPEADETVELTLSNPVGIALGEPLNATLAIYDDDRLAVASFSSEALTVLETEDAVELTIMLNEARDAPVVVQLDTSDGTATAPADYTAVSEAVAIPAGESAAIVTVPLIADGEAEGDEFFSATLSAPEGAELGPPETATVTIVDDASLPRVSLSPAAVSVGEDAWFVLLDVVLDRTPVYEMSVRVRTVAGEAVAGEDFRALDRVMNFAPGVTRQPLYIDILDDSNYEPDESFSVVLSEPLAGHLGEPSEATVTILADDWPPFVYLADGGDFTAAYDAFEQNGQIAIPVRLSSPSGYQARVDYASSGGTATAGEDYQPVSGTLVFEPGQTEHPIVIPIASDPQSDSGETFQITLTNPVECTLDYLLPDDGVVTIRDDVWVSFAESEVSTPEDATSVILAVTLSTALAQDTYVSYSTSDVTATSGGDYTSVAGTLHFTPGSITRYITVPIGEDLDAEGDETFRVTLEVPSDVPIGDPSFAEVTIIDDDIPEVAVSPASYAVVENGGEVAVFVSLSFAAATDVSVGYATADGTAVDGLDFVGTSQTLVIPQGQTSGIVSITILNDALVEGEERFTLILDNAQGAALRGGDTATVKINDDELLPVIALPLAGRIYRDGDVIEMDATPSVVPAGFETWFVALRDNGDEPMDPAFVSPGLAGGFAASGLDEGYLVRLVIAAPGSMPGDAALRGRAPPCLAIPGTPCASAEVAVVKATSSQPTGFEVVHAYPEQVMLVWAAPTTLTVERSDDGGETWTDLGVTETERYFQDGDVVEGETYHYRGRSHALTAWTYPGDTTMPNGPPVAIPVWAAPRVLPQFDDVIWHCPQEASRMFCDGTLQMRLQAEPGTGSLSGASIRVYLNEETFELADGAGEEIHTEFNVSDDNYLLAFRGYDIPACVVRKPEPDIDLVVPVGEEEVSVDLDGVVFGANGFRFEVEMPSGDISERAMLVALMDEPIQNDSRFTYPHFLPILFGSVLATNDPQIRGRGPAGRHSPDCVDGDSWIYFDHGRADYNGALFFNQIEFAGEGNRLIWTDGAGSWSAAYNGVAEGVYPLHLKPPGVWPDWGMLGRDLVRPNGGLVTDDYATEVWTDVWGARIDITVDTTVVDFKPSLSVIRDSVLIDSPDQVANAIVPFRITDADHNLDMETVQVFNCSLEACDPGQPALTPYRGFYWWNQWHSDGGDYGWFVADVPLVRGENQLRLCATDADGNVLGTPENPCVDGFTTRESPLVMAVVTEPAVIPHSAPPGAVVPLDGSQSVMPVNGVALWTTGVRSAYLGNPWQQVSATEPTSNLDDLVTITLMPYGDASGFRARLVVAASVDDLPDELWPEDGSLPCERSEGDGSCDSFDVRFDAICSYSFEDAQVVMDQPSAALNVGANETIHLLAHVESPSLEPFAYRWLVYRGTGSQKWLVTTIGADHEGEGFSITNNDLLVTPAGQGLETGIYSLYAEARYPASGCSGPLWYRGNSDWVRLTVGHTIDGVAPGRVVEGGTFRVYSNSLAQQLTPGELGVILIDDDTDPYDDEILQYLVPMAEGGYFELWADSENLPANGGTTYYVRVAEDQSWTGLSSWAEFHVEPAGTVDAPNIVVNDESNDCGAGGVRVNAECAHPVLPGQTWQGEWGEAGDSDYFTFVAGAGTEVQITLERADTSLPPQHPETPMPEILLARPDGLVVAASDPLPPDVAGTSIDTTLSMDGRYFVIARTASGSGSYLVSLEKAADGGDGAPAFGYTKSRAYLATSSNQTAWFRAPVLDGFGNPISGGSVIWEKGEDCGDGSFCPSGQSEIKHSDVDGLVVQSATTQPDTVDFWRPTANLPTAAGAAKSMRAERVGREQARSPGDDPVLGRLRIDGLAVIGADLPDLETVHAIWEQYRLLAQLSGGKSAKAASNCNLAELNCGDDSPVFSAAQFVLDPGKELVDVQLQIFDGGEAINTLDGEEVTSAVPLSVEATACVQDALGVTCDVPIDGPVAVLVTGEFDAALEQGGVVCDHLSASPGPLTYWVGSNAVMNFTHLDGSGDPCCWLPTEWIDAAVVANVMVDDGQGGFFAVSKRAETTVESIPRPGGACEIRPFPPGPYPEGVPEIGATFAHLLAEGDTSAWQNIGSAYVVDGCGNLEFLGVNDPPVSVVSTTPDDPQVWTELRHEEGSWEWRIFLHSTHFFTDDGDDLFFIPSNTYTTDLAVDGASECGGTVTYGHTVDYDVDRPTIQLVWEQKGYEPLTPVAVAGSALRYDGTGEVIAWRVRPADSDSGWNGGSTIYSDIEVKLYVAENVVTWDLDGNVHEMMRKIQDAELCVGEVHKHYDPSAFPAPGSDVTTITCEEVFVGETEVMAYTEPEWWTGGVFDGPIGISAGVVKAPGQPGNYYLVAEPLDETFRRGDSWRIEQDVRSAEIPIYIGTYRKDFDVVERIDPTDLSCFPCESCPGGDIVLRNGNARHSESDPVPGLPGPLGGRTCDSLNSDAGVFGTCWTSAYDAGITTGASKAAILGRGLKSAIVDEIRVTTEDNRTFVFQSIDGGAFFQSWPEGGVRSRLIQDGADYVFELSGNPYRRTYRGSDGRLVKLEEIASGRHYTIAYDGATGTPTEVTDSWRGSIATFDVVGGLVTGVTTSAGTVSFEYGGDATLDSVNAAGATWRTYAYSGENQLTEISDGAGHLIDTYTYADGLAATSVSAGDSITAVEWGAAGPRPTVGDEQVVRTDSAAGASTYYYQRWIAGAHRVVEVVGECACSGNDRAYAYDALGNLALEQDGRGYITRHKYLGDGRKSLDEMGLRPASCDPTDFPDDPAACRLTIDELEALGAADLVATDAYQLRWYAYDDPSWPDRPTQVCRSSVLQLEGENDRVACSSTTYDGMTGQWISATESGWTGQSAEGAVLESRTATRTFYGGAFTSPAFDPGGAFDPAWLAVAQPDNLVRSTDGPRTDVADVAQLVYYPVVEVLGAPVPEDWRGRLAAQMDPLGYITRYEDYDEWGNVRRIIGPTGIVTEMTYDEFGRVLTRTLVGDEGCDPGNDPLCTTDLVTTSTYGPGAGPIESITSPGGSVTEYAYDGLGRMLTTDRGPTAGLMLERIENEYDPVTGLRIRDSRLAYESGPGWVEHSRTDYQHYLTGQLVLVERPRFDGDASPSEAHYTYDVGGRITTVQDPNHTAPNVEYFYDPLGRLVRVRQLLDPEAPPAEQWVETSYGYDSNGNLITVADANANVTEYLVDDFGQTLRITSPVTGVTEMAYDGGGNLVKHVNARGVSAMSDYDASGRPTGITYDDGVTTETLSFFYDPAGRRTTAEAPGVVQTFTPSRRGLILTVSQELDGDVRETSYSYDLDGRLESLTYPSGRRVALTRDFAGRATAINSTAPGGGSPVTVAENIEYLPFGPPERLALGPTAGRLSETREHDWHYRRTSQLLSDATPTTLLDLGYAYDPAGNLTALTDNLGGRSANYDYDDLGRLTGVTWADGNRSFKYDPIGNLERIGVDEGLAGEGQVIFGYVLNPEGSNSPVLVSTETFQGGSPVSSHSVLTDEVGNVTSDSLTNSGYNLENHLADREFKGVTLDYTYAADGRLIRSERSDTGVVTEIVLDIAGRRLSKLEDGSWRDYVYLGDQLMAYFDDTSANPVQVIADHIGMPMMAVDGAGTLVWQAKVEPYGELRGEVGLSADPGFRYPGQWQDELDLEATCIGDNCTVPGPLEDSFSLFENGYRWYKPRWGRYGQGDPIGLAGGSHLYGYGLGNPLSIADIYGLQPDCCPGCRWKFEGSGYTLGLDFDNATGKYRMSGKAICKTNRSLAVAMSGTCEPKTSPGRFKFGTGIGHITAAYDWDFWFHFDTAKEDCYPQDIPTSFTLNYDGKMIDPIPPIPLQDIPLSKLAKKFVKVLDLIRFWEGRKAGLEYEAVHYGIGYGGANWQVFGSVKGDLACEINPD